MLDSTLTIDGIAVPGFLYGTAWKEDDTAHLTELALRQGFRGIDTANQRRHYHEAGVGEGIASAIRAGIVTRDELFIQTKFTYRRGQDDRLPYDPKAPLATQVIQSFELSLEHLSVERIESLVLHGPALAKGLNRDDWEVWGAMEALLADGRLRFLGVSNIALDQLQPLCREAKVAPRFVQNRCYASRGWDSPIRAYCKASGIVYQGFSLLTANPKVMAAPQLLAIAKRHGREASQIIFRFAVALGMLPLTGTRDAQHMSADLDIFDFELAPEEVAAIEALTGA
jgi:diketogulonate reductase-like aldo/keto reductase